MLRIAMPTAVVAFGGLGAFDGTGLGEGRALRAGRHPLGRRAQALEIRLAEDGFAREEAVFFVSRALDVGQLEVSPFQGSLRRPE